MGSGTIKTNPFDTKKSVRKASAGIAGKDPWMIESDGKKYTWSNRMERVEIVRRGIPYHAIEVISKRLNRPVKSVLTIVGIPQTTYNKKKSELALLDTRDSELIVLMTELMDYGQEVFNEEHEKFQRWLQKPNLSLGGRAPISMFDTISGMDEVYFCLNRIEYGNLA